MYVYVQYIFTFFYSYFNMYQVTLSRIIVMELMEKLVLV
jgi:hypothetical protein